MKISLRNIVLSAILSIMIFAMMGATCTINPVIITYSIKIQNFSGVNVNAMINNMVVQIADNGSRTFENLSLNSTIRIRNSVSATYANFNTVQFANGLILPDTTTYYVNQADGSISGNEYMLVENTGTVVRAAVLSGG